MSAYRVEVREFAANAGDYLRRTEDAGECFTLTRAGEPVAVLAPVRRGGRMEELPRRLALSRVAEGDADAFAADTGGGFGDFGGGEPPRDPWAR